MRKCIAILAVVLAGCTTNVPPKITDFNGDSVKVSVMCDLVMTCAKPRPEDLAQAQQACSARGRTAQFASTAYRVEHSVNFSTQFADHLYICA